jgi:hypothetical protein
MRLPHPSLFAALSLFLFTALARAEVTRFEEKSRTPVGTSGYEKITGTLHFAVAPAHPRNRVIADLALAPVNAAGRVEFSADLVVLRPATPTAANTHTALLEVSNRGGKGLLTTFNKGAKSDPLTDADLGDNFLFKQGFTLVWVGWEFDVPPTPGLLRIQVPIATDRGKPITGPVSALLIADVPTTTFRVTDLAAYAPADPTFADATLSVRASRTTGTWAPVPRDHWSIRDHTVTVPAGFTPGRAYQLTYSAKNPPVAGLGFAAVRDTAAWLKSSPPTSAPSTPAASVPPIAPVRHTYAYGTSQSGRFLRDFLYHGFNTDEHDRTVFDAVWAHIAGAARLDFNRRWSTPRSLGQTPVSGFPFADTAQRDPVTETREGLLENPRHLAASHPKIFYTNTSVEYLGGGRVAALLHTDPAGTRDLALPAHVRAYAFAGTQHGAARFPPTKPAHAQHLPNPNDFSWPMRALLPALHAWVTTDTPPPPSAYPTFRDATLVPSSALAWAALPSVASPRALTGGPRAANTLLARDGAGTPLPLLVTQVDTDGNERAGLRLPEITVPLGTYTGWNFRAPTAGSPHELVMLLGSFIPFAPTRAAREAAQDPRPSIAERYESRAAYLTQIEQAARALVTQRLLLPTDIPALVKQAATRWDHLTQSR